MKNLALHWKILIAMVLGVAWAIFAMRYDENFQLINFTQDWIDPFGKIFINALKFIAVPLVLFSIITGVAGMGDPSKLGRMGGKTLGMYLITTVFSIAVGLVLVNIFAPGVQGNEETRLKNRLQYEIWAEQNGVEVKDGRHELATATPAQIANADKDLKASMETEEYKAAKAKQEV